MPQVTAGILLGNNCFIFRATGAPTASGDPDVQNAGVGSLYLRLDGTPGATVYALLATGWSAIA